MLAVNINLAVAAQLKQAADNVNEACDAALDAGADELHKVTVVQAEKIEDRPIPKRPRSGKDMWERHGNLKKSIKIRKTARSRFIESRGKASRYHKRREGLGLRWMPKKPAGDVIRKNPYMHEGREMGEAKAVSAAENKFREKLNL